MSEGKPKRPTRAEALAAFEALAVPKSSILIAPRRKVTREVVDRLKELGASPKVIEFAESQVEE